MQASAADWLLRAGIVVSTVVTLMRRPEALMALALLMNWVRPTPRHRVTGIVALFAGALLLATESPSSS